MATQKQRDTARRNLEKARAAQRQRAAGIPRPSAGVEDDMTQAHTIEIEQSSKQVRVEVDGVTVADSRRPRILTETGCPPRYYLPLEDVKVELLNETDTHTTCPFKGTASYWSVEVGDQKYPDIVWTYKNPIPGREEIAGLACFYNEKVDLYVDGELQ